MVFIIGTIKNCVFLANSMESKLYENINAPR